MQDIDFKLLTKKINIHYNISEIKILCLDLDVEFENLEGQRRIDISRELVDYMKRYGRISELLSQLSADRPGVDFLEELSVSNATKELPADRKKELSFLFNEWTVTHEELVYWKGLHNHLDELLTVFDLFEQTSNRLQSTELDGMNLRDLKSNWMVVEDRLERLISQALDIQLIASNNKTEKHNINLNKFRELDYVYKRITLRLDLLKQEHSSSKISRWNRKKHYIALPTKFNQNWTRWWEEFANIRLNLKKNIRSCMSFTDDMLQSTANRLSKQTERIRGEKTK